MNRPHSHRNLLWSGHWLVVFHKRTGTLLYSLFVSWLFYWQSNGRVDGLTMCILSDAYDNSFIIKLDGFVTLEVLSGYSAGTHYIKMKKGRSDTTIQTKYDWLKDKLKYL